MSIRINNLKLSIDQEDNYLFTLAAKKLKIEKKDIDELIIVRKSVDARRQAVCFNCSVEVKLKQGIKLSRRIQEIPDIIKVNNKVSAPLTSGSREMHYSPVVVGSGPAGLFCALCLARHGYRPVVIERGKDMDRRVKKVDKFWSEGILDETANTQFGEGGAGTFSDGKLTTRIGDERVELVLKTFVEYGADEEILYLKKPHVGTDVIRQAVKKIRQEIIDLGGEFYFQAQLTDININNSSIKSIIINHEEEIPCSQLVLAVGNSARDVYRILDKKAISLIPKAFAMGARVEHPQEIIDKIQYGDLAGHPRLPAADYHLTYQDKESGRSMYSFCMCPGGYVIGSASTPGQVVSNGMSYFKRDSGIANSALVVTIHPSDWNNTALGGMQMQEELEQRAFKLAGSDYTAPAQYLKDFLECRRSTKLEDSIATFKPGISSCNLWDLFPEDIAAVMKRGIISFDQRMHGFICDEAVLTGVETRTSAPLRIQRDESMCSVSVDGMYPCGEGAGYAGGIVSAAVDGLKVAERIITTNRKAELRVEIKSDKVVRGSEIS